MGNHAMKTPLSVVEFENKIVPIQTYFINGEYVEYFRFLNSKEMFVEEN